MADSAATAALIAGGRSSLSKGENSMTKTIGDERWAARFRCIGKPFSGVGLHAAVPVEPSGPASCEVCGRQFLVGKREHALRLEWTTKEFGVVDSYSLICAACAGLPQDAIVGAMVRKYAS
jgi:hypothetical protein